MATHRSARASRLYVPFFIVMIAAALVASPVPNFARSGDAAAPAARVVLSVETDPIGAAVYIDGKFAGQTPLQVKELVPGDHRVRLVKDGYVENSRVLSVGGNTRALQVKLTRAAATEPAPVTTATTTAPSGNSKKWLWIGIAGGGAAAAIAAVALTKNSPPNAGTIGVNPGGTGMVNVTSFSFTAQGASDPNNDTLSYTWNFGDGATGTGATATHVYSAPGTYKITLSVSDGKKSANAPDGSVTVAANLSGGWSGATDQGFSANVAWTLTQTGLALGGTMTLSGSVTGSIGNTNGTVGQSTYPTSVDFTSGTFTVNNFTGTNTIRFVGTTDATGATMTGTLTTTNTIQGNFTKTASFHR
jgi:hypothetical protein